MSLSINNPKDFLSNIEEVATAQDTLLDKIKYDNDYLVSDHYNYNYKIIEKRINDLYVKTRVLYDIAEYVKYHLDNKIIDFNDNLSSILNNIEHYRDALKYKAFITYNAKFARSSNDVFLDRDNATVLPEASISNAGVTLARYNIIDIPVKSASIEDNLFEKKRSDISGLLADGTYKVFYYVDVSASPIIREKINIIFEGPVTINYINLNNLNCVVSNVMLINSSSQKEPINPDIFNKSISLSGIYGFEFTIECSNYENINFTVYSKTTSHLFNLAYDYLLGNITYDEMSKSSHYSSYQAYLKAYDDWYEGAEKINKQNYDNGYALASLEYNPVPYQENITEEYLERLKKQKVITAAEAASISQTTTNVTTTSSKSLKSSRIQQVSTSVKHRTNS